MLAFAKKIETIVTAAEARGSALALRCGPEGRNQHG